MDQKIDVLIIENESPICEMLKDTLDKEGIKVSIVGTGKEALMYLKDNFFNIVVLDLKLPDLNSLDLLRALKNSLPAVSVLVIADEVDLEKALTSIEEGAYCYIIKPFNVDMFKVAFKKGLENKKRIFTNIQLLQKLKEKKEKIEEILQISEKMNSINDINKLVNFIISELTRFLGVKKGSLMLVEEGMQYLVIKAAKGIDEQIIKSTKIKIADGIAGWIAQEGKPWLVDDIEKDSRTLQKNKPSYVTKSFMSLPLRMENKVRGVINFSDKMNTNSPSFTEEDLKLTSLIIRQASTAIQNCFLNDKINQVDIKDAITGVFNKRYLHQRLNEDISRVQRYNGTFSLIMMDIDYFREYSDRVGCEASNTAIKEIAQVMKENIRGVDTLIRYEGGCFILILPETEAIKSQKVAEKIKKLINKHPFPEAEKQPGGKMTISGGIAEFIKDMNKSELLNQAYQALLNAKKSAEKNKICIYSAK